MDTHTAIILGLWAFSVATAMSNHVEGGFMVLSYTISLLGSILLA